MRPYIVRFAFVTILAQTANSSICNINGVPSINGGSGGGSDSTSGGHTPTPGPDDVTITSPEMNEAISKGQAFTSHWHVAGLSNPYWSVSLNNADGSHYRDIGVGITDGGNGNYTGRITIPSDVTPGEFQLEIEDTRSGKSGKVPIVIQ